MGRRTISAETANQGKNNNPHIFHINFLTGMLLVPILKVLNINSHASMSEKQTEQRALCTFRQRLIKRILLIKVAIFATE